MDKSLENMPRNFFNILRDNPESWGGKENPLTLPTTRSSDKAQKSSATVKISAVRFLCYKSLPESLRAEYISSNPGPHLQPVKVIHLQMRCNNLASRQAHSHEAQRALFYVKTN
ncbi:TPA: hypothetical protein N8058_004292 [Escherichia fergusonii]|uniref:hypothetical protein n=1 Tax=Escherichia fergusonii TaxID=564 RepID=UPI003F6DA5A2|nr:hypothetical protein [Escherichia fergusonii]HCO5695270.1 hypothetical protein [Escherichia fergusonii]